MNGWTAGGEASTRVELGCKVDLREDMLVVAHFEGDERIGLQKGSRRSDKFQFKRCFQLRNLPRNAPRSVDQEDTVMESCTINV